VLDLDGREINLIDTPGEQSFIADAITALSVCDGAVFVVNAAMGVEVGTAALWRLAGELGLARLIFVNALDRERADFFACLDSLKKAFGPHVVATELPIGVEHEVRGLIDLIDMRAWIYADGDGRERDVEQDIPPELAARAQEYRDKLMDEVAENSDALLEHYLEGARIEHEEIVSALKDGVTAGKLFPITCGIATANLGTDRLLQAIVEDLPSPVRAGGAQARDAQGEEILLEPDEDGPLVARVFKTQIDQFVGRINMFRVYSGVMHADSQVHNSRTHGKERLGHLLVSQVKDWNHVPELGPGEIGAVSKLKDTRTGDILTTAANGDAPALVTPAMPTPAMAFAVEPRSHGDEDKMGTALRRMCEEDPTLDSHLDSRTGEHIIAGLSAMHIDVAVARLRDRYGVDVELRPPRVAYQETIKRPAKGHGRYKKQTGGRGQFGDCHIEIEPLPHGAGFEFVDQIKGGVIPHGFIPAVAKGIREAMEHGALAGYPVRDLRVRLVDGSHHTVDSSEAAFKVAGSLAFKEAAAAADPVLLEPIMSVHLSVPDDVVGDVIGDLSSRRGHPLDIENRGATTEISAEAPIAELLDYAPHLDSLTSGRGHFTMHFLRYEELPPNLVRGVVEDALANA
jgi:elongation factor G